VQRFNLSAWAVAHRSLTGFLIALIFVAGGLSYSKLGRSEDPSFTLKLMVVTAAWPGATASETQQLLAERIERKLQDTPYLDHLDTYSRPGFVATMVTFRDSTPPREVPQLFYQVRKKLDDLRPDLPAGVFGPFANDEFTDVYGAVFALTGTDNATLVRQAEAIRDRMLKVPGAEKVNVLGEIPRTVFVEFNQARLASLGVTVDEIAAALARQNQIAAAGIVDTPNTRVPVRVTGALAASEDGGVSALLDMPVASGGRSIRLGEVARIRGEMMKVIERVGFQGSFEEFLQFLRTDPRFRYTDPQELLQAYLVMSKRIDPLLPQYFGRLPRMPYGVRPIPAESAPDTTTAYYQPPSMDGRRAGYYYVNLYKPEERPTYEIPVLSIHEAVPGHHLQIALAQELGEQPKFRRNLEATAYTEGWALYSESLGEEMGLYADPYDKFGQLTYEMRRAVRLVVDTGIHQKRWTREQAIEFFKANAAKSELDIVNEIDRYISWPGQALAYKIGELRIKELRAKATQTLGPRFDLREFHDVVLGSGAIPLDVLEGNVKRWIDDGAHAAQDKP
jgi:hypothetical protein